LPDAVNGRHGALVPIALFTFALDQAAKLAAVYTLPLGRTVRVIPGVLALRRTGNPGALLGTLGELPAPLFVVVPLLVLAAIAYAVSKVTSVDRSFWAALGLVIGGGLGNVADRVLRPAVVDFLSLRWGGRMLLTFNLADVAIVMGLALLAWQLGHARRPVQRPREE
jgi:signal peptidase II